MMIKKIKNVIKNYIKKQIKYEINNIKSFSDNDLDNKIELILLGVEYGYIKCEKGINIHTVLQKARDYFKENKHE